MVLRKLRTKMTLFLWFCAGIFILFIFLEWGMQYSSTRKLTPQERGIIGIANGISIPNSNYSNLIEQYRKQGTPLWKCRELAFNALVEEALLNEVLENRKIGLTDGEVVELIKNNPPPALLEDTLLQTNGKFDFSKYHALLSDPANIRWVESYEAIIRTQVPRQILYQTITSGIRPTTIDLIEAYMQENIKLELEYVVIDSTQFDITEPMLLEYYNTHKDEFVIPEISLISYVVFEAAHTTEDEIYIKEEAKELFNLAKEGRPLDSLSIESGYPILTANPPVDSLTGPIKREDGYHILKGDKDLCIPLRVSDETLVRVEEEAINFIESAKSGFEEAIKTYGLEVLKVGVEANTPFLKGVDLSYIDLKKEGRLIGPVEGPDCFYILYTLGTKKTYAPEFYEIKDKVYNKYWRYRAKELAQQWQRQTRGANFREMLSANGIDVEIQEFSNSGLINQAPTSSILELDSLEKRDLFLKALNIPENGIAIVDTDNRIYLVHCSKRHEPTKEDIEKALPELHGKWMKEEAERIYEEWLTNLKGKAEIKDYRYKIY